MDGKDPRKQELITIRVVEHKTGEETLFKIMPNTKMKKMMDAYAQRTLVPVSAVQFRCNGSLFSSYDTPKMLELRDGDRIDCMVDRTMRSSTGHLQKPVEQANTRGTTRAATNEDEDEETDEDADNSLLSIRVRHQDGQELPMKVRRKARLEKVFIEFAAYVKLPLHVLQFLFDGQRLNVNNTPKMLDMEENDLIECCLHRNGGQSIRTTD